MKHAEPVEVVGFEPPLPAESVPPLRVTTPVVEAPLVMVEHVQPAPVVDLVAPEAPATVAEYVAPAPVVTCAAPAPVIFERIVEVPEIQAVHVSQTFESLGTAYVCRIKPAETEEVVEFRPPLLRDGSVVVAERRPRRSRRKPRESLKKGKR